MRIVAPSLLVSRKNNDIKQKCITSNNITGHVILNKLDQNVFKANTKCMSVFPRIIVPKNAKYVSPTSLPKRNQVFRTKVSRLNKRKHK